MAGGPSGGRATIPFSGTDEGSARGIRVVRAAGQVRNQGSHRQRGDGRCLQGLGPVLNRFVAIKVIAPTLVSDEQFRQRFLREARSAAGLNHRNIVTVFEFNEAGQVFMVMEFLEGTDLREAIARRTLTRIEDKLAVIEQVCDGLAFAHRKGIVHRDLKPANIRLLPNLTSEDHGLRPGQARGLRDHPCRNRDGHARLHGPRAGSRPKRWTAGPTSFSVGAVLYHLLSGRKPFASASMHSIFREVLERDPPPLRSLVPDLRPLWMPIVERAMAKDLSRRFESADALRDALRDARRAIAASRAVAAALMPESEDDPTLTHVTFPPSASSPSVPGASRPGLSSTSWPTAPRISAGSVTADLPPSPPTVVLGATALELSVHGPGHREGSTARPHRTLVGKQLVPPRLVRPGRSGPRPLRCWL